MLKFLKIKYFEAMKATEDLGSLRTSNEKEHANRVVELYDRLIHLEEFMQNSAKVIYKQNDLINALKWESGIKRIPYIINGQINKSKVTTYISLSLGELASNKTLINIGEAKSEDGIISVGRPEVLGSSTLQMRHSTPYSFSKVIIANIVQNDEEIRLKCRLLVDSLCQLMVHKKGYIIDHIEYITKCSDITLPSDSVITLVTKKDNIGKMYHLIGAKYKNLFHDRLGEFTNDYNKKLIKYIKYQLKNLDQLLIDDNTMVISFEYLARQLVTIFNIRPYASFPKEGHSYDHEVRLFKSEQDASNIGCKNYRLVNCDFLWNLINKPGYALAYLNKKIRLVNNEGDITKKVKNGLGRLSELARINQEIKESDNDLDSKQKLELRQKFLIDDYNSNPEKYKVNIFVSGVDLKWLDLLNSNLTVDTIVHHTVKLLYKVFDWHHLDNAILEKKPDGLIQAYPSSNATELANYNLIAGVKYRNNQVETAKKSNKYNSYVTFRSDVENDLAQKYHIIKEMMEFHCRVALMAYPDLTYIMHDVLKDFINCVELDNGIQLNNDLKQNLIQTLAPDDTVMHEDASEASSIVAAMGEDTEQILVAEMW